MFLGFSISCESCIVKRLHGLIFALADFHDNREKSVGRVNVSSVHETHRTRMCTRVYAGRAYRSEGHKHGPLYTRKTAHRPRCCLRRRCRRRGSYVKRGEVHCLLVCVARTGHRRILGQHAFREPCACTCVCARRCSPPRASASVYATFVNTRVTCCLKTSKCET